MEWLLNLFKYKPKFAVGDIIATDGYVESWEVETGPTFRILEVGKYKYRICWNTPVNMTNWPHGFDNIRSVDNIYEKVKL